MIASAAATREAICRSMCRGSFRTCRARASSRWRWPQTFRRIFIPLLMPSLLAAFIYTMIVAFREISAAIFLYTSNTEVVSVQVPRGPARKLKITKIDVGL